MKKPGFISVVILALGLGLTMFGSALLFIDPSSPYGGILALSLVFMSLVGIFVFAKVYSLMNLGDKRDEGTNKSLLIFATSFLAVLLVALLCLQFAVGVIPMDETKREPVVTVAEERVKGGSVDAISGGIAVSGIEGVGESEIGTSSGTSSEAEGEGTLTPSVPEFTGNEASFEPSAPVFVETESTIVPSAPTFVDTTTEVETISAETEGDGSSDVDYSTLIPRTPSFVSAETSFQPSAPVFVSAETEESEMEFVPAAPEFAAPSVEIIPSAPVFEETETSLVPATPVMAGTEITIVPSSPSFISVERSFTPSSPEIISIERTLVPSEPVMKDPVRVLVDIVETKEEEYDPWADFFVSGDDFTLFDGLYWFDLFVNDTNMGVITVNVEDGEVYLSYLELQEFTSALLSKESNERIFSEEVEWIGIPELISLGVDAYADIDFYAVYLTFGPEDMPLQVISIRGSNSATKARPISGSVTLTPASWYLQSSYTFGASLSQMENDDVFSRLRLSLSSNNSLRIQDVYGRFTWSAGYSKDRSYIQWGSYSYWRDFADQSIRLQWGNVSPDLLSTSGVPLGIRFDKSSQYGSGRKGANIEKTITVEKDSDVRVFNGDKEIYRKNLTRGIYSLQDFVLYTGANHITIEITPLDGSEKTILELDVNYSTSLLAPGEAYYGAAFAFGRKTVSSDKDRDRGQFEIFLLGEKKLQYDLRDVALSAFLNVGISNNLTGSFTASFKSSPNAFGEFNPQVKLNSELTSANAFGTAKMNLNLSSFSQNGALLIPNVYMRASQQVYTDYSALKAMTFTLGYTSPTNWKSDDRHSFFGSASVSGSVFSMGYSTSISGTLVPGYRDLSSWYLSSALSFMIDRVSISLSSTFSQRGSLAVDFSGRISATFKLGPTSNTASYGDDGFSLATSANTNGTSLWAKTMSSDIADINKYGVSLDFSRSGSLMNLGGSFSFKGGFNDVSASLSATTSVVVAEKGLWSIASSIPSNFLLVRQKGSIRKNTLAVGEVGSSSQDIPSSLIGDTLYRGLSTTTATSLSLYSYNADTLGGAEAYSVFAPLSERKGFVLVLEGREQYTLAGTVTDDEGNVWSNGSSPVYKVSFDSNGLYVIEETDLYLFTDRKGLFVLSELEKGLYAFDTKEGNRWVMNILSVGDDNRYDRIGLVSTQKAENSQDVPAPYQMVRYYGLEKSITADAFWKMIYGEDAE